MKNDNGFSVVELMLIILVTVIVGLVGWYVWANHSKHKAITIKPQSTKIDSNTSTSLNSTIDQPATVPQKDDTPEPSGSNGYLVIKELGVKLAMADADKLTYRIDGNPTDGPNADNIIVLVWIKLNSSVNTTDACRELGVPLMLTGDGYPGAVKIGKSTYIFDGNPSDPCGDSQADKLREKIETTQLVNSAIKAI